MTLYINTTQNNLVELAIKDKNKLVAFKKFSSHRKQAEKLLPAIEKLLKAKKLKLSDLDGVAVENRGGSFTSLRIGVVTANALAYALGVPVKGGKRLAGSKNFSIIEPIYDREPEITVRKKK